MSHKCLIGFSTFFDGLQVDVTFPNKKPAKDVPVQITAVVIKNDGSRRPLQIVADKDGRSTGNKDETSIRGEAEFVIDVPRNTRTLDIKVSYTAAVSQIQ